MVRIGKRSRLIGPDFVSFSQSLNQILVSSAATRHAVCRIEHQQGKAGETVPLHFLNWVLILTLGLAACSGGAPGSTKAAGQTASQMDGPSMQMMPVTELGEIAVYQAEDVAIDRTTTDDQRVIFVHGTPGDAMAWRAYLKEVPKGFHYLAYDRPGFGESTPGRVFPSLEDQARALEPLLPEGQKSILVGHSLGGPIIAKAAVLYPDRIGGLVMVAGSLDPDLEKINPLQYLGRIIPFSWLLPQSLDHANREIFGLKPELQILQTELHQIQMPVTIIQGTRDRLVPYANVPYMEREMTEADLTVVSLEGANHFLPWNAKKVVDDAILAMGLALRDAAK